MPASDFSKKLAEAKEKAAEKAGTVPGFEPKEPEKVEEAPVVEHPLTPLYKKLEAAQAGRNISEIPLTDSYWEVHKSVQQAEFQRSLNK